MKEKHIDLQSQAIYVDFHFFKKNYIFKKMVK